MGWRRPSLPVPRAEQRPRGLAAAGHVAHAAAPGQVGVGRPAALRPSQDSCSPKPSPSSQRWGASGEHFGHSWLFFWGGKKKKKAACFIAEKVGGLATAVCSPPGCRGVVVAGRWRDAAVPLLPPPVSRCGPPVPEGGGETGRGWPQQRWKQPRRDGSCSRGWEGCGEGRGTGESGAALPGQVGTCARGGGQDSAQDRASLPPSCAPGGAAPTRFSPACPSCALVALGAAPSPPPQRHRAGGNLCSAPEHLTPPRTSLAARQAASLLQTAGAPSEPSEGDSSSRRPPARARRHSAQGELKKIGIFIQM